MSEENRQTLRKHRKNKSCSMPHEQRTKNEREHDRIHERIQEKKRKLGGLSR